MKFNLEYFKKIYREREVMPVLRKAPTMLKNYGSFLFEGGIRSILLKINLFVSELMLIIYDNLIESILLLLSLKYLSIWYFAAFLFSTSIRGDLKKIATLLSSLFRVKELKNYIYELKDKGFVLEAIDLEDYFETNEDVLKEMNKYSVNPILGTKKRIGKIVILSHPNGLEMGQFKAFPIHPVQKFYGEGYKNNMFNSQSVIFVREKMEDLTNLRRFILYHELSHLTWQAASLERFRLEVFINFLYSSIVIIFILKSSILFYFLFIFPYFMIRFLVNSKEEMSNRIELFCDGFALSFFNDAKEINIIKQGLLLLYGKRRMENIDFYLSTKQIKDLDGMMVFHGQFFMSNLETVIGVIPLISLILFVFFQPIKATILPFFLMAILSFIGFVITYMIFCFKCFSLPDFVKTKLE